MKYTQYFQKSRFDYCFPQCLCKRVFTCIIIFFLCFCGYLKGNNNGIESDPYYLAVVEGIIANKAKLKCGVLRWEETNRYLDKHERKPDTSTSHNMWWNGEKKATRFKGTVLTRVNSQFYAEEFGVVKAYNGKEYREMPNIENPKDIALSKKTNFTKRDDFLRRAGLSVEGTHLKLLESNVDFCKKNDTAYMKWESVKIDNNTYIKLTIGDKSTGRYGENLYDPSKGFNLISAKRYASSGKPSLVQTYQYVSVKGNAWFPSQLDSKIYKPDTGEIRIEKTCKVDMEKSSFNDPSVINDEVFELKITNDMEISDYRGGVRLNYERDVTPLAMEELIRLVEEEKEHAMTKVGDTKSEASKETSAAPSINLKSNSTIEHDLQSTKEKSAVSPINPKSIATIEHNLQSTRKSPIILIILGLVLVFVSIVFWLIKVKDRKVN